MSHTTLTSASTGSGYWWERFGTLLGWTEDLEALQGAATTSNIGSAPQTTTRIANVQTQLGEGTAEYDIAAAMQSAADDFQSSQSGLLSAIQQQVQQLLINMTNKDAALTSLDLTTGLEWLVSAMIADSATINQGTVPAAGAQTAKAGVTVVGDPTFVVSVKDAAGRALQYTFPETLTVTVTSDGQIDSTLLGSEPFSAAGQNAQDDFLAWDWLKSSKYGSGASITGSLVDPNTSNTASTSTAGGANVLVNGTFTTATTANVADNWTIATGSAGSSILVTTGSNGYKTGYGALEMVSDGSTLLSITQSFNTASTTTVGAGGTPFALVSSAVNNFQYAVFVPYKLSAASPAAGVLTIDLIDGGGSTIADDAGTNNSTTVDLTAVGDTNWHVATAVFRMPAGLPTSTPYKLRIYQSTAVTTGKNVYLSGVAMAVMQQLYAGGPYFAGFRGSTDVNASGKYADAWTFAISYTPGKFQKGLWRYFNPPGLTDQTPGIIVPAVTSGSATIADTLVA